MNREQERKLSKFLALVLRHQPECIGITLDPAGWIDVDVLLAALRHHGRDVSRENIEQVVRNNDKQRYVFSEDGTRIRATQGHSTMVDLGYAPVAPPEWLVHGTTDKSIAAIRREGLKRMNRQHVHMYFDAEVPLAVAQRHGRPVLLRIAAGRMHRDGHAFFHTPNKVWLTDHVPVHYIEFESPVVAG